MKAYRSHHGIFSAICNYTAIRPPYNYITVHNKKKKHHVFPFFFKNMKNAYLRRKKKSGNGYKVHHERL